MAATKNMSDAELRKELEKLGFTPGPITESTRGVYEKKLKNLRANPGKSQKPGRKSEEGSRLRRAEPIEDNEGEWEDEEESTHVSHKLHSSTYGGSAEDRWSADSKSVDSGYVGGTGLWRGDRSSLAGGLLSRSTAEYGDHLVTGGRRSTYGDNLDQGVRSTLGGDRLSKYTSDYSDNLDQGVRSTLGGDSFTRHTSVYSDNLDQGVRSSLGGDSFTRHASAYSDNLDQGVRSTLGGDRFSRYTSDYGSILGQESRSSLGGDRFSRNSPDYGSHIGQEIRSTLGGDRFVKNASDYGSMGSGIRSSLGGGIPSRSTGSSYLGADIRSPLGAPRLAETSSDYGSLDQESRFSLGGKRLTKNPSDYGGQELRSRSTGKPWLRYGERDLKDPLFSKNYSAHSQGKSTQNWSKTLEGFLSKLVRALSVGLFIVFLGILVMKSGILYSTQQDDIKLIPPDCEGKEDKYCQVVQKHIILEILSELYNFLSLEAGSFECGNPSGLSSKCIPINRAKEHILNVFDHAPEKFNSALDWLLDRHEHLGIWVKGEDGEIVTKGSSVYCVESSRPQLGITCRLSNALYTAISNLFLALFGVFVLWLFLIYLRYHWRKLEDEEKQMFAMVEKIIDFVKHHYKDYQQRIEQNPFIGVSHVRDALIMPQDRKRMKKVWDRAVQFVEDHESRVRTESQRVAGADLLVWRWTQTRHDIPSERSSPSLLSTYT